MQTDPELLDEVRDPIAEDETDVVETGEENDREEGEERIDHAPEENVNALDERPADESADEIGVTEAEGPESDT